MSVSSRNFRQLTDLLAYVLIPGASLITTGIVFQADSAPGVWLALVFGRGC